MTARAALLAAAGQERDGTYDDTTHFLVIDASAWSDAPGEWLAVEPEDVRSVRATSRLRALAIAERVVGRPVDPYEDDDDSLEPYESALAKALVELLPLRAVRTKETLPVPRWTKKYPRCGSTR